MNPQDTKLYASADYYLNGPEGMRNEVLMWHVAAGVFIQELVRRHKGAGFGGLQSDVGAEVRKTLGQVSVLDICCGPGNFANYLGLAYSNIQVTGIDLNEVFLRSCQERFGLFGWQFCKEDARAYDLGQTFDFVVASSAYHHMKDEDKPAFLERAVHHLKPDGKMIVCENFLPVYADESHRETAVRQYYDALKRYYATGNGTAQALEAIEETYRLELAGVEEHKVPFATFHSHVAEAGLRIEVDLPIWQPPAFVGDNAGSHVLLLDR